MDRIKLLRKAANRIRNRALSLMIILAMFVVFMMPAAGSPDAVFAEEGADGLSASEPVSAPKPEFSPISVTVKGEGLSISWKRVKGAASYEVYRSYSKAIGYKRIKKKTSSRSFLDKKVKSGKKAYYKVRARNADGKHLCMSKVKSGKIYRVFIETGHGIGHDGKWDPGCLWNGYQEARLMVPVCKSFTTYLRKKGVCVYTDAYGENNRNLIWTLNQLQSLDVSVFVNVHCDYQYAPSGTLPLYRTSKQKKLANCLNKGIHTYVSLNNRGLQRRTDLKTLNNTPNCVACLVEIGGIKADNTLIRTRYNAYGKGLAKGVCDYLGIKW